MGGFCVCCTATSILGNLCNTTQYKGRRRSHTGASVPVAAPGDASLNQQTSKGSLGKASRAEEGAVGLRAHWGVSHLTVDKSP